VATAVKVCTDSTAPDQLGKNTSLLIEDDELAPSRLTRRRGPAPGITPSAIGLAAEKLGTVRKAPHIEACDGDGTHLNEYQ
jgi:hypothetical protein